MAVDGVVEMVSEGGNLLDNLSLIDVSTWEDAPAVFAAFGRGEDALMTATNNIADYTRGDGTLLFTLTPGVLLSDRRFRQRTYVGIVRDEFFVLDDDMAAVQEGLIKSGKAVQVPYNRLTIGTEGCYDTCCFVEAKDSNTDADKKLLHGFYGTGSPGSGRKVYLLRESALEQVLVANNHSKRVARACYFDDGQDFGADGWLIDGLFGAVRGVRLEIPAEGGAFDMAAYATTLSSLRDGTMPKEQVSELYNALLPSIGAQL